MDTYFRVVILCLSYTPSLRVAQSWLVFCCDALVCASLHHFCNNSYVDIGMLTLECLISVVVVKHQHDIAVELLHTKTVNVDKLVVENFVNVGGTFHVERTKGDPAYH